MIDKTTKVLLTTIALGLFTNATVVLVRPTSVAAQEDYRIGMFLGRIENTLSSIDRKMTDVSDIGHSVSNIDRNMSNLGDIKDSVSNIEQNVPDVDALDGSVSNIERLVGNIDDDVIDIKSQTDKIIEISVNVDGIDERLSEVAEGLCDNTAICDAAPSRTKHPRTVPPKVPQKK